MTFIIKLETKSPGLKTLRSKAVVDAPSEEEARKIVNETIGGTITHCVRVPEQHIVIVHRELDHGPA